MKYIFHVLFAVIILFNLPVSGDTPEITVISHELKPFTWEENGTLKGFAYDMVVATMRKMDIHSEIKLYPFKRALNMVQHNRNTVLFHVQRTVEREKTMKWVGPIVTNGVYVYCRKKPGRKIRTVDDLRKLKYIAVVRGEATDEYLSRHGFTNLVYVRQQEQSLEMIASGKADASAFGELVIDAYARGANIDISHVENTGIKLFDSVLYIGFSNDIPDETVRKWQNALEGVKREKYTLLYNKYITKY